MSLFYAVLGLVVLQRLAELVLAARNTGRLRAEGAFEIDARGYPAFVLLHGGWLLSLALLVPATAAPSWPLLALYAVLQLGRVWVIARVRRGPYRFVRHPNYLIVAAEIAVLPLAFGAVAIAVVFSIANLLLVVRRIAIEERALAPRRQA